MWNKKPLEEVILTTLSGALFLALGSFDPFLHKEYNEIVMENFTTQ